MCIHYFFFSAKLSMDILYAPVNALYFTVKYKLGREEEIKIAGRKEGWKEWGRRGGGVHTLPLSDVSGIGTIHRNSSNKGGLEMRKRSQCGTAVRVQGRQGLGFRHWAFWKHPPGSGLTQWALPSTTTPWSIMSPFRRFTDFLPLFLLSDSGAGSEGEGKNT